MPNMLYTMFGYIFNGSCFCILLKLGTVTFCVPSYFISYPPDPSIAPFLI